MSSDGPTRVHAIVAGRPILLNSSDSRGIRANSTGTPWRTSAVIIVAHIRTPTEHDFPGIFLFSYFEPDGLPGDDTTTADLDWSRQKRSENRSVGGWERRAT